MLTRISLGALALYFGAVTALAEDTPKVPASAKKLDAAGISEVYSGTYATFNNFTQKASLTGESWYDIKNGKMWGNFVYDGKNRGVWKGDMAIKGDKLCYKPDSDKKRTCSDVYRDGQTFYEVSDKGVVQSMNQLHSLDVPAVPASAKKASIEEFAAAFSGKPVFVTLYDMGTPIVASVTWDLKKKRVSGEAIVGGTKRVKFNNKYTFKDDTICHKDNGPTPNCYTYYLDGNTFYEIKADGSMHGKSVMQ